MNLISLLFELFALLLLFSTLTTSIIIFCIIFKSNIIHVVYIPTNMPGWLWFLMRFHCFAERRLTQMQKHFNQLWFELALWLWLTVKLVSNYGQTASCKLYGNLIVIRY